MVRRSDMFCKVIAPGGESGIRVLELAGELRARGHSRIPFVAPDDRFVYIAHRSMLDQFLVEQMMSDPTAQVGQLTLEDLFARQPRVRDVFAGTAAFVGSGAMLGDAKIQMNATPSCYDVFVTDRGSPGEPIFGWITDVIVADSEPT